MIGEEIICINNNNCKDRLTIGKKYTIIDVYWNTIDEANSLYDYDYADYKEFKVLNDLGTHQNYSNVRFINIDEWRDLTIGKLLS